MFDRRKSDRLTDWPHVGLHMFWTRIGIMIPWRSRRVLQAPHATEGLHHVQTHVALARLQCLGERNVLDGFGSAFGQTKLGNA